MNYPLRMCLGETLFLSRWLLFCHDCFPEVRLGRRNAASHTNIAHRHFRPRQRAQHHQIIEIAQMPEAYPPLFVLYNDIKTDALREINPEVAELAEARR